MGVIKDDQQHNNNINHYVSCTTKYGGSEVIKLQISLTLYMHMSLKYHKLPFCPSFSPEYSIFPVNSRISW